jgi:hypothetical protein
MTKKDLAERLARQARLSKAAAADQLDRVVHDILVRLRRGKPASLPGLGTFIPGGSVGPGRSGGAGRVRFDWSGRRVRAARQ